MESRTGYAEVNGARLYYEIAGSGHPLILIHGHTLDTRMWDDQFEVFSKHYQVVRFDMRGYGKSDVPTSESYSETDDLRALMTNLDIQRAHILGLSKGGAVAVEFALTYPEATTTLIAVDSFLRGFQWKEFGVRRESIREAGLASGVDAARDLWLNGELFIPAIQNPKAAPPLTQIVQEYSGWHWINDDTVRTVDPPAAEQLDKIGVPTLVIIGEHDLAEFRAVADLLQSRISNAQKILMAGVGHMSNMEDPEKFNEIVLNFLSEN